MTPHLAISRPSLPTRRNGVFLRTCSRICTSFRVKSRLAGPSNSAPSPRRTCRSPRRCGHRCRSRSSSCRGLSPIQHSASVIPACFSTAAPLSTFPFRRSTRRSQQKDARILSADLASYQQGMFELLVHMAMKATTPPPLSAVEASVVETMMEWALLADQRGYIGPFDQAPFVKSQLTDANGGKVDLVSVNKMLAAVAHARKLMKEPVATAPRPPISRKGSSSPRNSPISLPQSTIGTRPSAPLKILPPIWCSTATHRGPS